MFGQSVDYYQPILLAQFADDFDGDEIGDLEDSCPIVSNLFIDVDEDGVDDTCDGVITAVMSQDQSLGQEEFNSSEQKAQVLGVATTNSDQEANQEVLGSSLENSGTSIMSFVFIGGGLLLTVFVLARYSKNYKYKLQK